MTAGLRRSVSSLRVPNYRRWFLGQVVSVSGTWMQTVAEAWLILRLTGSGVALGFAAALQFLPLLLLGSLGGVLADRVPKRRLLAVTQLLMAVPALVLFVLSASGVVALWMVLALVTVRGLVLAVDNPARQSFVSELVGPDRVVNAVSLNALLVQTARVAGPAAAALVIATVGVSACFALNALSFVGMLVVLARLDPSALHPAPVLARGAGQVREGWRAVRASPALWVPLALTAVIGMLAFNFQVVLPLLARDDFGGGAGTYALLTGTMGAGAIAGALAKSALGGTGPRVLGRSALAFGLALSVATVAPTLAVELAALLAVGAASVTFTASANASLQVAAAPALRGRVMALYAITFLGSTPIGAPLVGWACSAAGPRLGLAIGAAGALLAGALALGVPAWRQRHPEVGTRVAASA